ncbi:MAG: winged helix-turn-helix domain-containing protein [Pseudomonadota bacterium]
MTATGVTYRFGEIELDTRQHSVFQRGARIELGELSYRLLLALVEAAPRALSHEQIQQRVWQGRVVSPETISQRVRMTRKSLGDNANKPQYIRGIRGFGYQLVAPVSVSVPAELKDEDGSTSERSIPAGKPSIVILPFFNDDSLERSDIALGLSQDVLTRIARTRSFFVIGRGTAQRFSDYWRDPCEISRLLGVRYVVQGRVFLSKQNVNLLVSLSDGSTGEELWIDEFAGVVDDVFEIQEAVVSSVVRAIESEVNSSEQRRAVLYNGANLDAWTAYHRGCFHMFTFSNESLDIAEQNFRLSAQLDPLSARAFAGLSYIHWQRAFLHAGSDRQADMKEAYRHAEHSLMLDARDPMAHWAMGRAHLLHNRLDLAVDSLRQTVSFNPSFAVGRYSLGFAQMHAGEAREAIAEGREAERLSPFDPLLFAMRGVQGFSMVLDERYEEGNRYLREAADLPNAHYQILVLTAFALSMAGREDEGRRYFQRVLELKPEFDMALFERSFPYQRAEHRARMQSAYARLAH